MNVYQLKIELAGSHPAIWRRLAVPGRTPFSDLHDIIQISMGWRNEHPYEFTINKTTVRDFGGEVDTLEDPYDRDSIEVDLEEMLTMVGTRFIYTYGSEDVWEHRITLEKILGDEEEATHAACMAGEGDCPPEDCGGISGYQQLLLVMADKKHPEHDTIAKHLAGPEGTTPFDIHDVNARLRQYADEWGEIYQSAEATAQELEDGSDEFESDHSDSGEYQFLKLFSSPADLQKDEFEWQEMEGWMDEALAEKGSAENKTFLRLVEQGHDAEKSREMIRDAFTIEWFYDLKYGTGHLKDRFHRNLQRLPEAPEEIHSINDAVQILNECTKGIPFKAIEYLHDDPSPESTTAIIQALQDFSDNQNRWNDSTPLWYSLAAEGHLCQELIDPVIGFYKPNNKNATDWIHDQGQYLIGKLAQQYPDITAEKVLTAMEKDAENGSGGLVFYLFDVFDFCSIEKYKDRLLALLKRNDIFWHDMLAMTIAHLQIKEALPILKEQLSLSKAKNSHERSSQKLNLVEIEESIRQLETGEDLYPDINIPLCLTRDTTWKEEFADAEEYFYYNGPLPDDNFDRESPDYFDRFPELFHHQPPIIKENKTGRNDPCPCGSGKKYKKCCLDKDERESRF